MNQLQSPFRPLSFQDRLTPKEYHSPNHGNAFTSFGAEAVVGGWVELDRTTLGSAATTIDVTGLADKRYYMLLTDLEIDTTVGNEETLRTGNGSFDTSNNYAYRRNINGGTDTTTTTTSFIGGNNATGMAVGDNMLQVTYGANVSGKEKLIIHNGVMRSGSGAGNSPDRFEVVGKWVNTSNPLDRFRIGFGNNTYTTGSELVVLGWDPADTHTTNFWEELASVNASGSSTNLSSGTISAKKYLWIQCYLKNTTSHTSDMTFNNDTTTYAYRNSDNGAADGTSVSQNEIELFSATTTPVFVNMFIINNSANEKLVIGHTNNQNTAGSGTASNRREFVGKWDNTASQITEIDIDSSSGNWDSVSKINVYGSN